MDHYQAEASRALQEAQVKIKSVQVEVNHLKVASKVQSAEVEHFWEALLREE